MELVVYNTNGKKTDKKVKLDDAIFGIKPNDHAIYLDVKSYMAAQRQGTHKTKERSDLSGSTRKIRKQKSTGAARLGDIKSPILRGGARAFGPKPRDYSFKLNKKVKQLARKSALSYKAQNENIIIIEDFNLKIPKTQEFLEILKNLSLDNKKSLIVLKDSNKNVYLSTRNLKNVKVVLASSLNTYDVMRADNLTLVESSIGEIK